MDLNIISHEYGNKFSKRQKLFAISFENFSLSFCNMILYYSFCQTTQISL